MLWQLTGEMREFLRRCDADPALAGRQQTVKHLQDRGINVLELDIAGKYRLLADWSGGRLTLLDFGDKPVVPNYRATWYGDDMRHAVALSEDVLGVDSKSPGAAVSGFFGRRHGGLPRTFDLHDDPAWAYFLDEEQGSAAESVLDTTRGASMLECARFFLMGGPGTGKTAILLNLFVRARLQGLRARLSVSDEVAEWIENSGVSLRGRRLDAWGPAIRDLDLLLIDDPGTDSEIEARLVNAFGRARAVVVAFDPLQLRTSITDERLDELVQRNGVDVVRLKRCYRQRAVLGAAATRTMRVLAKSSPFNRRDRTESFRSSRAQQFALCNDLEFVNAGGNEDVVTHATATDAHRVIRDIRKIGSLWTHTPAILLVVEEDTEAITWDWSHWLRGLRYRMIGAQNLEAVKGVEYQHAILVIGQNLYRQACDGFEGVNERTYERRKLLRIPFTRARDTLTVLVVDEYISDDPRKTAAVWAADDVFTRAREQDRRAAKRATTSDV